MKFDLSCPTQRDILEHINRGKPWDAPMVRAIVESLSPGDTFIDVGGHVGYFSAVARQRIGDEGRIIAFEPDPRNYALLVENIAHPKSQCVPLALGKEKSNQRLRFHANTGCSSIVSQHEETGGVSVEISTLDDWARGAGLTAARLMKIDVEGMEDEVIAGGWGLIENGVESVIFEVNNSVKGLPANRERATLARFFKAGFSCYMIRPWMEPEPWLKHFGAFNYLRLAEDAPIDINYGDILATRRTREAAVLKT